ncbi:hypothetical protein DNM57_23850 [Salmonella enterica subsp. enterica serovar Choleraesuis]|uniref:Uncharacterized protein n=2 Tax=Salmonella enterica TaxID=28901 RepID=A0A711URA0_SALET|nr:hypothetical protein [Salmonella enterica subsp. enterica serovar Infantis]EAP9816294.1 hypothetical protein [Salmonella enterica]EBC9768330.1 hypothetical protein [Salmonella enterica subsp. enterica serovar Choleraesuis]ECB1336838.1 hypothetical protein [Salmonella enterica subsp. enterica serovar Kunzendorf]ECC9121702.1 hypothetical protein [Salmonella enterica subsp. enterica]
MLCSKKGLLEQIYSFSVFPALAGINCCIFTPHSSTLGVPRASGDKPLGRLGAFNIFQCSPRQRG